MNGGRTCLHFLFALAISLVCIAVLFKVRPQGTPLFRWAPIVATVLACADPLGHALDLRYVGHIVCSIASGAGTAYLFCRWFALFRTLPFLGALKQLTLAFSFSALIRFVVMLPADTAPVVAHIMYVGLASIQVVVLYAAQQAITAGRPFRTELAALVMVPEPEDVRPKRLRSYGFIALELGIYGILFGLLRTDVLGWSFTTNSRIPGQLTQIVVPLVLFAWLALSTNKRTPAIRAALLAVCAVALGAVLFADAAEPTLSVVMFALRCLISMVIYVRLFEISYRFHTHPCVTYGLGRAWFGFMFIAGLVLYNASLVRSAMDSLPLNVIFFFMACVILLLLNSFSNTAAFSHTLTSTSGPKPTDPPENLTFDEQCARAAERFGLSEREQEVLRLTCAGLSKRVAAEELCISEDTVRYHTKQLYRKLDVHNRQELMLVVFGPSQR